MVQFKVLTLVKVGIMIISSFMILHENAHGNNSYPCIRYQENSDTIKILGNDYKILLDEDNVIKVQITNTQVLQTLKEKQDPVILFSLRQEQLIARGNNVLSSSVPHNCDLFYFMDKKGYPVLFENNVVDFRRIAKVKKAGFH